MFTRRSLVILALTAASLLIVGAAVATVGDPGSTRNSTSSSSTSTTSVTSTTITTTVSGDVVDVTGGGVDTATEYAVADAGTVMVAFDGATLQLSDVTTFDGWTSHVERASGPEVEVKYLNGSRRVDFEAEIEDGMVKTRVRERALTGDTDRRGDDVTSTTVPSRGGDSAVAADPMVIDASPAGSITVQVEGAVLVLVDVRANDGWQTSQEVDHNEIKVKFRNGSGEVEVEVELEHGELRVKVESDQRSGSGDSSGSEGDSGDDASERDDSGSGFHDDDDEDASDDDNSGSGSHDDDDHDDDDHDDDDGDDDDGDNDDDRDDH